MDGRGSSQVAQKSMRKTKKSVRQAGRPAVHSFFSMVSARAEQHFHGELIQPLIAQPALAEGDAVEGTRLEGGGLLAAIGAQQRRQGRVGEFDFLAQRLNLRVGVPARGALL